MSHFVPLFNRERFGDMDSVNKLSNSIKFRLDLPCSGSFHKAMNSYRKIMLVGVCLQCSKFSQSQ